MIFPYLSSSDLIRVLLNMTGFKLKKLKNVFIQICLVPLGFSPKKCYIDVNLSLRSNKIENRLILILFTIKQLKLILKNSI